MPLEAVVEPTDAELDERRAFAKGLRELADVYEVSEELPLPYSPAFDIFLYSADDFGRAVRSIPGRLDKRTWGEGKDSHMEVSRKFGSVRLCVNATRSLVCTPRIVGQEKVEVAEVVQPAVTSTKTVERDVIQWDCEPLLGRTEDKAA